MSDQRTDYYLGTYIILGIGSLVIIQFKPPVLLSIFDRKNAIYEYYQYEHVTICVTKGKNSVSINKTYYYVGDNNGLPWMLRGLERVTLDARHSKLAVIIRTKTKTKTNNTKESPWMLGTVSWQSS